MQPNLELVISQFYAAGLEAAWALGLEAFSPGRVAAAAETRQTRQSTLGVDSWSSL